jgi:hypothetical protein
MGRVGNTISGNEIVRGNEGAARILSLGERREGTGWEGLSGPLKLIG